MKKITGILGGTFDPIHWGHIKIAQQLLKKLRFSEIRFLPNQIPAHRGEPHAALEHRINMIKLAIKDEPQFTLDLTETQRPGPSYMIDTLKTLREELQDAPLALILGADAFMQFNTWHCYLEIPNFAHLIVINRPNSPTMKEPCLSELLAKRLISNPMKLPEKPAGFIYECKLDPIPTSATAIREKLISGESIKDEVPPAVFHYIHSHQIYKND